jgi:hypothetical protein
MKYYVKKSHIKRSDGGITLITEFCDDQGFALAVDFNESEPCYITSYNIPALEKDSDRFNEVQRLWDLQNGKSNE